MDSGTEKAYYDMDKAIEKVNEEMLFVVVSKHTYNLLVKIGEYTDMKIEQLVNLIITNHVKQFDDDMQKFLNQTCDDDCWD